MGKIEVDTHTPDHIRGQKVFVHILLLGGLLALILLLLRGPAIEKDDYRRVVIRDSDIAQLAAGWERRWYRPPTQTELQGLLQKHVRNEVLYREALANGFDKNDERVRLTMVQKMDFLAEGGVQQQAPTEAEIESYYKFRQERYRQPAQSSFIHVFINPEKHDDATEHYLSTLLETLRLEDPPQEAISRYGDPFMLQYYYPLKTERELSTLFGKDFATEVTALATETWSGPVRSGYGLHLVKVTARTASYIPSWQEIQSNIVSDILFESKNAAREQFYQEILRNYQIVMEGDPQLLLSEDGA